MSLERMALMVGGVGQDAAVSDLNVPAVLWCSNESSDGGG